MAQVGINDSLVGNDLIALAKVEVARDDETTNRALRWSTGRHRHTGDAAVAVSLLAGSRAQEPLAHGISFLCIAHLGHTAHVLNEELVRRLGTIDIVMSPVDRSVTQSYDEIFHNIKMLKPRMVIPMHDLGWTTMQFIAEAQRYYPIRKDLGEAIEISRDTLPRDTEVWVLKPRGRFGSY